MDEETYKKLVKSRLDRDDFIEDDDGSGYVDDGREVWHDRDEAESEDEGERRQRRGEPFAMHDIRPRSHA